MQLENVQFTFKNGRVSFEFVKDKADTPKHQSAEDSFDKRMDGKPYTWLVRRWGFGQHDAYYTFGTPTTGRARRILQQLKPKKNVQG